MLKGVNLISKWAFEMRKGVKISLSIETPPDFKAIISVSEIFGIIFFTLLNKYLYI